MELIPYAGDAGASWMPYFLLSLTMNLLVLTVATIICLCKCIQFGNRGVTVQFGDTTALDKLFVSRKGHKVHQKRDCLGLRNADGIQGFHFCKLCFKVKTR